MKKRCIFYDSGLLYLPPTPTGTNKGRLCSGDGDCTFINKNMFCAKLIENPMYNTVNYDTFPYSFL